MINYTELLAIIAVVVIFIEQDFVNMLRKMTHKKSKFGIGFFGILAITIFVSVSGLGEAFFTWLSNNLLIALLALVAWLIFLYVMINKGVTRILGFLTTKLEGKR